MYLPFTRGKSVLIPSDGGRTLMLADGRGMGQRIDEAGERIPDPGRDVRTLRPEFFMR